MAPRFKSIYATPPGDGMYRYELDGVRLEDRSAPAMRSKIRNLRTLKGLPTIGEPMDYCAEYMCPHLPDGWCSEPSTVKVLRVDEIKEATKAYFAKPLVPADEIERRLQVCMACPAHDKRVCITCTGLLNWMQRGFGGRRVPLPIDSGVSFCRPAGAMASAVATVHYPEGSAVPEGTPSSCWRNPK